MFSNLTLFYAILLKVHIICVSIFLGLYVLKTILLLSNKEAILDKLRKIVFIPEMIISFLFLLTGIIMLFNIAEIKNTLLIKLGLVGLAVPLAVFAFKTKNKTYVLVSLFLLIGIYGLAEMSKKVKRNPNHEKTNTISKEEKYGQLIRGRDLYNLYCTTCHGVKGDEQHSGAKNLITSQAKDELISNTIINGKSAMPKYKKIFNKEEIKALVEYVKILRKQ